MAGNMVKFVAMSTDSTTTNTVATTINTTMETDIMANSCFNNFEAVACMRSALLTVLAIATLALCILKIVRLHRVHHQNWHQYFIFYCASLECVIGGIHWILAMFVQFDFVLQWLKLVQFLVMCHFYWTLATRALRREIWTTRFLLPFLAVACGYFTVIAILGIINVESSFIECLEPYWIELSAAEFTITQLFCVAGFYITRRLNEISTLDSVRRSQKWDLWCIVIVFEISAFIGVLYDVSLRIVGDQETGCSAIFNHAQKIYSPIFLTFMVSKLLLPIWVMLFVFQPTPQTVVETDDLLPALTDDGTSAFSATIDEQYRQLYHPAEDYHSIVVDSSPQPLGASPSPAHVAALPSLGPIKEEQNSGSNQASRQNTPASHSQARSDGKGSLLQSHLSQNQSGNVNQTRNSGPPTGHVPSPVSNTQPVPSIRQPSGTRRPVPTKREGNVSVQGADDDSDAEVTPSPKGKFYI